MNDLQAGPAVLHSCSNCSTRELPAIAVDKSTLGESLHLRLSYHRAFSFTQAITRDIQAANEAGITPNLLSVGPDGWVCDERKLLPWLQASQLEFDLVLRLNGLHFGMSDRFVQRRHNVYWGSYKIDNLQKALERGPSFDPQTDELIACWKTAQTSKDTSFGINVCKNAIDIQTLKIMVEHEM